MSDARSEIGEFIQDHWGETRTLPDDADVFHCLGIEGDDAAQFMKLFAARFAVDVSSYRWYFHHAEEGWNLGALLAPPPDRRVERIPITPLILAEAIRTKQWPVAYPPHLQPHRRWDLWLNSLLAAGLFSLALWAWLRFGG